MHAKPNCTHWFMAHARAACVLNYTTEEVVVSSAHGPHAKCVWKSFVAVDDRDTVNTSYTVFKRISILSGTLAAMYGTHVVKRNGTRRAG